MMEKRNSDEIDLYDLLVKTIFFFRANFVLFLVFSVAGIVCSVASFRLVRGIERPVFKAKVLVYSKTATHSVGNEILNSLNTYISDRDTAELARILSVTPQEAAYLGLIRTEGQRSDRAFSRDSIYNLLFDIHDKSLLPKFSAGIVAFVNDNSFVRHQMMLRKKTLSDSSEKIAGMEIISSFAVPNRPVVYSLPYQVMLGFAAGIAAAFAFIILRAIVRIARS